MIAFNHTQYPSKILDLGKYGRNLVISTESLRKELLDNDSVPISEVAQGMLYLIEKPYKNGHIYSAKYAHESKELAIRQLSRYHPRSSVFSSNSYWIEDEAGNVICSPRQTKKEASKKYINSIAL